MKEMHSTVKNGLAVIAPQVANTDQSAVADLLGFHSAEIIAQLGAAGDTLSESVSIALKLEHSEDGSEYTPVGVHDVYGLTPDENGVVKKVEADADAAQTYACAYIGNCQFVKPTLAFTGTHSTGTPVALLVQGGHPDIAPVD